MVSVKLTPYGDGEALRLLGERIRDERLRRNLPQQRLAEQAGISVPTYRKIENGDGSVEIGTVARVLGIMGHVGKLGELVPAAPPPIDRKALFAQVRTRARLKSPASGAKSK